MKKMGLKKLENGFVDIEKEKIEGIEKGENIRVEEFGGKVNDGKGIVFGVMIWNGEKIIERNFNEWGKIGRSMKKGDVIKKRL